MKAGKRFRNYLFHTRRHLSFASGGSSWLSPSPTTTTTCPILHCWSIYNDLFYNQPDDTLRSTLRWTPTLPIIWCKGPGLPPTTPSIVFTILGPQAFHSKGSGLLRLPSQGPGFIVRITWVPPYSSLGSLWGGWASLRPYLVSWRPVIGISCSNVLFAHFNSAARHPLIRKGAWENWLFGTLWCKFYIYSHDWLSIICAFINRTLCQDRSLTSPERSLGKLRWLKFPAWNCSL